MSDLRTTRELRRALDRSEELREDIDHDVEGGVRPAVAGEVDDLGRDLDAARLRQSPGLGLRRRRKIDRQDIEPLLREPDAVAAFAIGDGQRAATFREQVLLSRQKDIGCRAEDILGSQETTLPPLVFTHHG